MTVANLVSFSINLNKTLCSRFNSLDDDFSYRSLASLINVNDKLQGQERCKS